MVPADKPDMVPADKPDMVPADKPDMMLAILGKANKVGAS